MHTSTTTFTLQTLVKRKVVHRFMLKDTIGPRFTTTSAAGAFFKIRI